MSAGDIMVRDVVSVGPETPVREIASLMLDRHISGPPVVDGERRVLGIVSESDLIRRLEIGTYKSPAGWLSLFISQDDSATPWSWPFAARPASRKCSSTRAIPGEIEAARLPDLVWRRTVA